MKERVFVTEVGPRDGLQNERAVPPTPAKIAFVEALVDAGLRQIEVTSFVHPRRVPAMADAEAVMLGLNQREDTRYVVLTPNLRGYERARDVGAEAVAVFTAASEAFTQANVNMSVERSLSVFREIAEASRRDGVAMRGYVSTVVACPLSGPVRVETVRRVCLQLLEMGCDELSLGDTIGVATPTDIRRLLDDVLTEVPVESIALHLHDTWGMASANVMTALDYGVRRFDASAGGLGGCPFAPGATGNLATEDLLYLLEGLGYETGVNMEGVALAAAALASHLDRELPGRVHHALLAARERAAGRGTCADE